MTSRPITDNGSASGAAAADGDDRHFKVAIIGTGFSGLGMAIRLRERGFDDFVIFERAGDVAGTWRDNTYPGIACDVPSNLYSFSFALNPDWSKAYSPGDEIWDYLRDCAVKFELTAKIRFNHDVTDGVWEQDRQRWRIDTSGGTYYADVVIGGMGPLSEPAIPAIDGVDRFEGVAFHSAQWDHDFDLAGKRVAVIGTGASAIQFVPQIQPLVDKLYLFQRTPPWVLPRNDRRLTDFEHKLYRRFPVVQKAVRAGIYTAFEARVLGFVKNPRFMKLLSAVGRAHLAIQVRDAKLRRKLTPNYVIGCKRILLSNDYYPALTKPNVDVITDGVKEVRERSIVTSDGSERPIDAIIWGTGFHVTDTSAPGHIVGLAERRLSDVWGVSPQAYLGTTVPGFPNLFMMLGPNTGLGHSSMIYMIESQINYILGAVEFIQRNDVGELNLRGDVLRRYNADLQEHVKSTVWNTGGCASWYLDAEGRNTVLWPGFTFTFRERTRHFDPGSYELEPRRRPIGANAPQPAAV